MIRRNRPASLFVEGTWTRVSGAVFLLAVASLTAQTTRAATIIGGVAEDRGLWRSDGTGAAARFDYPFGVAVDTADNVYVADRFNDAIRKITPGGVVTTLVKTVSPPGSVNPLEPSRFSDPFGVAVDVAGNIYVADTGNGTIRKIVPTGVVTNFAGTAGIVGTLYLFNLPTGVAVDGTGNVYVADSRNEMIRKVTPAGIMTTLAGTAGKTGSADGVGSAALFDNPTGVAVDVAGNVYVADSGNDIIRKITLDGVVTTLAGTADKLGSADGAGSAAQFNHPFAVAVDGAGNVYVADSGNDTIRKIAPGGVVTTLAGTAGKRGSADGAGSDALFNHPFGVAVDAGGNVFVADSGNNTIRKIAADGMVTTFAGSAKGGQQH
jgi:streptogramin lyase